MRDQRQLTDESRWNNNLQALVGVSGNIQAGEAHDGSKRELVTRQQVEALYLLLGASVPMLRLLVTGHEETSVWSQFV